MNPENYFLPQGYVSRDDPAYFVDAELNATWQPDVYPDAAALAKRLGAHVILDVGCGTGAKLNALSDTFEIIGVDFGTNIAYCRDHYDQGTWIEIDLDGAASIGIDRLDGTVVVCADVIEHLRHPERLVALLTEALDNGAAAIVLSTPDRELISETDPDHLGPPANPAHAREWTRAELAAFLDANRLNAHVGLTRSNDVMPYVRTIFAVVPGRLPEQRRIVAEWFAERSRWERLAADQDRTILQLQRWTHELQAAHEWAEQQRQAWQRIAETQAPVQASNNVVGQAFRKFLERSPLRSRR